MDPGGDLNKDPPGSRTMNKIIFTIFMTCSKDGLVSKVKTNIQKIFGTEQHYSNCHGYAEGLL